MLGISFQWPMLCPFEIRSQSRQKRSVWPNFSLLEEVAQYAFSLGISEKSAFWFINWVISQNLNILSDYSRLATCFLKRGHGVEAIAQRLNGSGPLWEIRGPLIGLDPDWPIELEESAEELPWEAKTPDEIYEAIIDQGEKEGAVNGCDYLGIAWAMALVITANR